MERILISDRSEILVGRQMPVDLPDRPDRERVAVLLQPNVPSSTTDAITRGLGDLDVEVIELPDREEAKELGAVGAIYDRLADFNLGRRDTIVGVGGGAATDVAGFVAATWLRGVESVLVPTTLLGAVDAAIGGKTGINRMGKNLVGAFWHPTRVVVDLDVLEALPAMLRSEGSAEIVKAGLIGDPEIVAAFASGGDATPLDRVVARAIRVKADVVGRDFREAGERAILNFGHTIGHAVEIQSGLAHGFAVSIGMVAAGIVSARRHGFDADWLTDLLFSMGLPVAAVGPSRPGGSPGIAGARQPVCSPSPGLVAGARRRIRSRPGTAPGRPPSRRRWAFHRGGHRLPVRPRTPRRGRRRGRHRRPLRRPL